VRFGWLLCVCAVVVGCGNARTPAPDLSQALTPAGFSGQLAVGAGVSLRAPVNWERTPGTAPLVVALRSGLASVAIWRYPRVGALPHTAAQLRAALKRLVAIVRVRDSTFLLKSAAVVGVAHRGAIQLRGLETLDGQPRVVRSTHLYAHGAEVVIDALAPPDQFRAIDRLVFHPLLRALRVGLPTT